MKHDVQRVSGFARNFSGADRLFQTDRQFFKFRDELRIGEFARTQIVRSEVNHLVARRLLVAENVHDFKRGEVRMNAFFLLILPDRRDEFSVLAEHVADHAVGMADLLHKFRRLEQTRKGIVNDTILRKNQLMIIGVSEKHVRSQNPLPDQILIN